MLRGIYTGASGMIVQAHMLDVLANNMANVDTTGYKRDTSIDKAFPELLLRRLGDDGVYSFPFGSADSAPIVGKLGTGVELNEVYTVFQQGALKQTGNPLNFALTGPGFFSVETPEGERYTRNGAFQITKDGLLVDESGNPVLGVHGLIHLKMNNFVVNKKGEIYENADYAGDPTRLVSIEGNDWKNTQLLDQLKIVNFSDPRYLKKQGSSLWKATEHSGPAELQQMGGRTQVQEGFLEQSNVNAVTSMVRLIEVNRAYEANLKTIQTQDNLAGRLINDAVKV